MGRKKKKNVLKIINVVNSNDYSNGREKNENNIVLPAITLYVNDSYGEDVLEKKEKKKHGRVTLRRWQGYRVRRSAVYTAVQQPAVNKYVLWNMCAQR